MENKSKLVFITEDGVRVGNTYTVIVVDEFFKKSYWEVGAMLKENFENTKVFAHEVNANDHIMWNLGLFSLNDIYKGLGTYTSEFDKFMEIAKERSKNIK